MRRDTWWQARDQSRKKSPVRDSLRFGLIFGRGSRISIFPIKRQRYPATSVMSFKARCMEVLPSIRLRFGLGPFSDLRRMLMPFSCGSSSLDCRRRYSTASEKEIERKSSSWKTTVFILASTRARPAATGMAAPQHRANTTKQNLVFRVPPLFRPPILECHVSRKLDGCAARTVLTV
jgi:hypothetical protein